MALMKDKKTKRLTKETRSMLLLVAAAVAAKLTNRHNRLTLNRDTDMSITGGRHSFLAQYKAGAIIEDCGTAKLHALDVRLFNNGGCVFDLTGPVLDRALLHVDNCYNWPNFHLLGTPCKSSQLPQKPSSCQMMMAINMLLPMLPIQHL